MNKGFFLTITHNFLNLQKRNLLNEHYLGIDVYKRKRNEVLKSVENKEQLSVKDMFKAVDESSTKSVLFHQIKRMSYEAQSPEDVKYFGEMFIKYCKNENDKRLVFQDFKVVPVIMKMYHIFEVPDEAMTLFLNPHVKPFFHNHISFLILQDCLYKSKRYDEVCKVFLELNNRQIQGKRYSDACYLLFQAACYQMKTEESYKLAMEEFRKYVDYSKNPHWPLHMYTMIMAVENGNPEVALKYANNSDIIGINIILLALIKAGKTSDALHFFHDIYNKSVICKFIVSDLSDCLEKLDINSKSKFENEISEFNKMKEEIQFSDYNLETLAAKKVSEYFIKKKDSSAR